MSRDLDRWWFALGTLTRIPVPAPTALNSRTAAWGLAAAPLVGLLLGVASGLPLLLPGPPGLGAVLALTAAAWLTRALHWDGLADTADGLGSARPPAAALDVMKRSDIGPFGTLTLVLAALTQVAALAGLGSSGQMLLGWVLAHTAGRWALAVACGTWAGPARPDGLGRLVIGQLGGRQQLAAAGATASGFAGLWLAGAPAQWLLLSAGVAGGVAWQLTRTARRRFGGSTGDVLGAVVELTVAGVLAALAVLVAAT